MTRSRELLQAAKDAWGGRAVIDGRVIRDTDTGQPIRVFNVTNLEPLESIDEEALLRVAGIWEAPEGYTIVTSRNLDALGAGENG